MKRFRFTRFLPTLMVVLALGFLVVPAAYAALAGPLSPQNTSGGAVSHHYAPAPLDAGSAVPNPDYLPNGWAVSRHDASAPLDAGSAVPNPDYLPSVKVTTGSGFDWGDAGIGAGSTVGLVLIAMGCGFVVSRNRTRRLMSA